MASWNTATTADAASLLFQPEDGGATVENYTSGMPTAIRTTGYMTPYEDLSALDKFLLLSDEKREMANSIQKPLGFAFAAVAIPLALCNVIVFSQKDMRSASGTYVIALNLGQAFYILTSTVEKAWQEIVEIPLSQFSYCVFSSYFAAFAGLLVAKRGSYVVLCLASVERLYAVIRPLHIKNFILSKRPVACVLAVYAMTIILHLYSVTRFRLVVMTYPPFGRICIPVKTDIYLSYPELSEGFGLAARIMLTYVSLALQVILSTLTVWALRRHNIATKHVQSSASEDAKRQQERQLTVTLLGAAISFVALSLPRVFVSVFGVAYRDFFIGGKYENLFLVVEAFAYNLSVLACGVDFFCYLGLSTRFKHTLVGMFKCRRFQSGFSEETGQTEIVETPSLST